MIRQVRFLLKQFSRTLLHRIYIQSEPGFLPLLRYRSLAYSALACVSTGISGSASFQRLKKS
jgi:hypothetical protein